MMFSLKQNNRKVQGLKPNVIKTVLACAIWCVLPLSFHANAQTAVVPERIIYPGEQISNDMIREVNVTNPNLKPGYAKIIGEVDGFVSKRTLLPGRTIPVNALREAYAIERGHNVIMTYDLGGVRISANGLALQNAAVGDLVRARNADSGKIISGIAMHDGSLKVVSQ